MKSTFTNKQLCKVWKQQHAEGGTRTDVVVALMNENGIEDTTENRRKMYNNVTQRVKQLSASLAFPELETGRKGRQTNKAELAELQALLNDCEEETEEAEATEE